MGKRTKEMTLEDLASDLKDKQLVHLTLPNDFDRNSGIHPVEMHLRSLGVPYYFEYAKDMIGDYCLDLNEIKVIGILY